MQTPRRPASRAVAALFALAAAPLAAQTPPTGDEVTALDRIEVNASADASAGGLTKAYAGGQVARGGRVGILGNLDVMDTPFETTSYTNELIRNQQARSVGDVLLNDPSVRVARGFGNFQESYFIRGFLLSSDNVAYNGLYSLLPRQYIASELFERVEVLRGASAFLNGASPGGDGIGGSINLLPKRAPNQPLSQLTLGWASGAQQYAAADVARRFGPDGSVGVRLNAAHRKGGTGIDSEKLALDVFAIGLDWRGGNARLSADLGHQENRLRRTRTNVTLAAAATAVPSAPDAKTNWSQPWSYSNERDTFGTVRGELDLGTSWTAWIAGGLRRSNEANSLANITITNAATGAATTYRFDNTREDLVDTGEIGLRGKLATGPVKHALVFSASWFRLDRRNAYGFSSTAAANLLRTNLYDSVDYAPPRLATLGNTLENPLTTGITRLASYAIADTLSALDDRVLVTVGARHQQLDLRGYAYNTGAENANYDKRRTSPVAGAVFKVAKELSLYANYIEGLTQGDTAPSTAANIGTQLAPYVSKQKEIGAKVDAGRIGGSVALFTTTKPRSVLNAQNVFSSEGEDRHRGVELSVFGVATDGVRVLGGVTYLDADQRATGNATTDGKTVIGVPRWQSNFGVDVDVPWVQGLSFDARAVATAHVYANAANTLSIPGWTRIDAGVRYAVDVMNRPVTFRLRVDNLTGRDYWASAGGYPNNGYLVLGGPRTVTGSMAVDF